MRPALSAPPPERSQPDPSAWVSPPEQRLPPGVPLALAFTVTALLMGPIAVGQWFAPLLTWLPYVVWLVALESVYTTLWLAAPAQRLANKSWLRLGEVGLWLVSLRLLTWYIQGNGPDATAWRAYLVDPWLALDGMFLFSASVILLAWAQAALWGRLFGQISSGMAAAAAYGQRHDRWGDAYLDLPSDIDRADLLRRFVQSWAVGGILLLLTTALTTFDIPRFDFGAPLRTLGRLALPPHLLWGLLVYFLGALWLTSQARYQVLQGRWLTAGLHVSQLLTQRWQRFGWLALGVVGLMAALLPMGSTVGLARLLELAIFAILALVNLLLIVVAGLIAWILRLVWREGEAPTLDLPTLPPPAAAPTLIPAAPQLPLPLGGLLWGLTALMLGIIILFFAYHRLGTWRGAALQQRWLALWAWLRDWQRTLAKLNRPRRRPAVAAPSNEPAGRRWWAWPGLLTPQEQIRLFYLTLTRRAGDQGVARPPAQTPLEYTTRLGQSWPEAEAEIEALTQAFIEARYTPHIIPAEQVGPVQAAWRRARTWLRRPPHADQSSTRREET